jgi:hypothetical protein
MADDNKQETFDLYSDAFTVTITPFGANLTFSLREAHPSPSQNPKTQTLGTMRMSVEHLKVLIWICRKQIRQVEGQMGVSAEVPMSVLNQLGIPPDEWREFWKSFKDI